LTEKQFVDKHFRTLLGKIFKPDDMRCLILALERDLSVTEKTFKCLDEEVFSEIISDCEYFHISPKEIFPIGELDLPEATFASDEIEEFNESLFAYSIRRDIFESKKIGEKYRLPGIINGKKLTGTVLGDCNVERIGFQKSFLDEYYFLPCKD
jgi:hypothetical protein